MRKKWRVSFLTIVLVNFANIGYSKMEVQQNNNIIKPSNLTKSQQSKTAIENRTKGKRKKTKSATYKGIQKFLKDDLEKK